jgi:multidrug efflux pump subunit AcrB
MWIVLLALRRPYTFIVGALLLVLGGAYSISRTPTDILPALDIPVISVVWTYEGLPAQQIERQITQFSEYSLSSNVADVARIESQSFDSTSVIRVFLQPTADPASAMAQITAASQAIVRRMPPGTQPPIILRYSASSVPILQISFTSDTLSESEIFDHVNQRVRTLVSTVRGTRLPLPMGGRARQITVDLDQDALKTHGLSPSEVAAAVSAQNLTLPTGNAKLGEREYRVSLNSSPDAVPALNDIPVRRADGKTVFLRDVAHVHDGFAIQTNIARQDGKRSVVLSVMKTGEASTTEVAERIQALIPTIRAAAPPGMAVEVLADQSRFVKSAIDALLSEGLIAAALTAAMILLFLGSWRSTLIVAISIPLSVLSALIIMRLLGYTLNAMTLGGLALAVGILVDDATVEIENIHRNLAMGKTLTRAILDGAQQIAAPAFVASSCISIVFISVVFLEGPARYLFVPMGVAVGLSVMASYLLSRTLIPTLVQYLLRAEVEEHRSPGHHAKKKPGVFARLHAGFNARFEAFQATYVSALDWALSHRKSVFAILGGSVALAAALVPFVGRDFFPTVSSEQIRLHVVAPTGTRIEETERYFGRVEDALRRLIPAEERTNILDQIGMPSGFNLAITDSANVSASDGEILVTLSDHRTKTTNEYIRDLRVALAEEFPELTFYFQPADIVTQILNFGLPSPIEVQISGMKKDATYAIARKIENELRQAPGAVDVRLFQVQNAPRLHFEVDRSRAMDAGLTQRDVANNLLLTVSSSSQVAPSFWIDPATGNNYPVSVRVPENRINQLDDLQTLSMQTARGPQLLEDIAELSVRSTPLFVTHVDIQPTFSVRSDVFFSDLGSVASSVDKIVTKYRAELPPGATITVRGQVESMYSAFARLGLGILAATLLVYSLLVVNFQSWRDPFIIITALSGAMVGIVLGLFVTQTTFSIPSLMGAIMSIGVATANSILVVSFAKEQRELGRSALDAAREAGRVRLRPVLMTALAMVIGMLPMAIGHGVGSEQNAALGRAVIGGLCGATLATLFLVPLVYSVLAANVKRRELDPDLEQSALLPQGEGA